MTLMQNAGVFSFRFRYWFWLIDVNLWTQDRERQEIRRNPQKSAETPYQRPLSNTPSKNTRSYKEEERAFGETQTRATYYYRFISA